jgi:hypothetical protein
MTNSSLLSISHTRPIIWNNTYKQNYIIDRCWYKDINTTNWRYYVTWRCVIGRADFDVSRDGTPFDALVLLSTRWYSLRHAGTPFDALVLSQRQSVTSYKTCPFTNAARICQFEKVVTVFVANPEHPTFGYPTQPQDMLVTTSRFARMHSRASHSRWNVFLEIIVLYSTVLVVL